MDSVLYAHLAAEFGEIYFIEIAGKEYVYRALTLEEIDKFERLSDSSADLEDIYVQNSMVYPLDFDLNKMKAGHVSSLAEAISRVSGLNADFILSTLDQYRNEAVEDILVKIKAMIIAAMPNYTDEYINTLTIKQLLQKLVLSEEILTIQQVVNGIQSENGVKLSIAPVESEQLTKQTPNVDKATLLRRIKSQEKEDINPFAGYANAPDYSQLEDFDTDILLKAAGHIDKDDPIARKLRKAMGG